MTFHELAHAFTEITKESSRLKITHLLGQVLYQASPEEARIICYLSLGTLQPPYKNTQFNFAEKSIIKVIATMSKLELAEVTAIEKKTGDAGLALLEVPWPYEDTGMSLGEFYDRLSTFQTITGTGSQEEKAVYLATILQDLDAESASCAVGIITGTMRFGFSDMTVVDALSWMMVGDKSLRASIENAYNICADIGLIAYTLKKQGTEGLETVHITLGIPIRPAAADRAESAAEVIEKIGTCYVEPKLDGFRLQIHIDNTSEEPQIWFFSRNLINMSNMFPDLVAVLKKLPVQTLICEGEALVFDEDTGSFVPFQETVKRKRKHDIQEVAESLPLHLVLFDILYVNGMSTLSLGHEQRHQLLHDTFKPLQSTVIQVIEQKKCTTEQELYDYFLRQISSGLEGVVCKRPNAVYQPGKRNSNWIKLKRHAAGHLSDTIDAVIMGYYSGRGKRSHFGIGAFLVGVYNATSDSYETIAKVGSGLTDLEWKDIKHQCDVQAVTQMPAHYIVAPELTPDVWVRPHIVVVIKADEITLSPLHSAGRTRQEAGMALRFPRFMGYSVDKTPQQATSIKELQQMYKLQYGTSNIEAV